MFIQVLRGAVRAQRAAIVRHPVVAVAVALLGVALLMYGWQTNQPLRVAVYLLAMWAAAFAVDVFCQYGLRRPEPLEVRKPGFELSLIVVSTVLAFVALAMKNRVFMDMGVPVRILNLSKAVLMTFFLFPVALAIAFAVLRYRPQQVGVRFRGIGAALVLVAVLALAALILTPESLQ